MKRAVAGIGPLVPALVTVGASVCASSILLATGPKALGPPPVVPPLTKEMGRIVASLSPPAQLLSRGRGPTARLGDRRSLSAPSRASATSTPTSHRRSRQVTPVGASPAPLPSAPSPHPAPPGTPPVTPPPSPPAPPVTPPPSPPAPPLTPPPSPPSPPSPPPAPPVTPAPVTVARATTDDKPGWGHGDPNHNHTGPPGRESKGPKNQPTSPPGGQPVPTDNQDASGENGENKSKGR
jgi:hypothetical protein